MANRHGLVTGATGTGKTMALQIPAESFCKAGVPVFAADRQAAAVLQAYPSPAFGWRRINAPLLN